MLVLLATPELDTPGRAGTVSVTGFTDSQVSAARGLTTAFPLCCVAMELSAQLEARGAELLLEWIPRGSNQEADRLADGHWDGFSPELRVVSDLVNVSWLVLPGLLASGMEFHARVKKADDRRRRAGGAAGPVRAQGKRKRQKLKEKEPW